MAQDPVDEDALFSDTSSVVDSSQIVNQQSTTAAEENKTVGFSGQITSAGAATVQRDWLDSFQASQWGWSNYTVANGLLDVRLPLGFKAFTNLELKCAPLAPAAGFGQPADTNLTDFWLRELFVDAHIKNRVYFRTGKQVLQWGRGYFFNPTDLINVEKKSFVQKIGYREGAYGLKMHVPFSTRLNLYGFLDTRQARRPDSVAAAAKVEVLAGGTEMALSLWDRRGAQPVYGFDFSTGFWDLNLSGEASLSYGDNNQHVEEENGILSLARTEDEWIPRASLSLMRMFKVSGVPDRMTMVAEFYYNGAGYEENMLDDSSFYFYAAPVTFADSTGQPARLPLGPKSVFLYGHGLYEMNNYSKYYAALFTSFSRFINSNMTLSANAIFNLSQKSGLVTGGLSYSLLNDFTLGLTLIGFVGPKNTEYTILGNGLTAQLTAGLVF